MQSPIFLHVVFVTPCSVPDCVITETKTWWRRQIQKSKIPISLHNINVHILLPPFRTTMPHVYVYWVHHHNSPHPRYPPHQLLCSRQSFTKAIRSNHLGLPVLISRLGNHIYTGGGILSSFSAPHPKTQRALSASQAPFLLHLPDTILHEILQHNPHSFLTLRPVCPHLSKVYSQASEVSFKFSATILDPVWTILPSYRCFSMYDTRKKALAIHNTDTSPVLQQWIQDLPAIPNLTSLDMTGTCLEQKHIPQAFSHFTNLTELYLVGCALTDFDGECPISQCIANSTSLVHLSFACNPDLTNCSFADYLGSLLQHTLTNLRTLDLHDTGCYDHHLKRFLHKAAYNASLTALDLSRNPLFHNFRTNRFPTTLEILSLARNAMDTGYFHNLLDNLQKRNPRLTNLDVRQNDAIDDFELHRLPSIQIFNTVPIIQMQHGTRISLSSRSLYCMDILEILPHPNTNLQYLDVSNNFLTYTGVDWLSLLFENLPNITYLDISNNALNEQSCILLADAYSNSRLSTLKIAENNLHSEHAKALAILVPSLTHLDISCNQIDSTTLREFNFMNASKLTNLNISHHKLDDDALPIIQHEILSHHPNLTDLDLSHNRFPRSTPPFFNKHHLLRT